MHEPPLDVAGPPCASSEFKRALSAQTDTVSYRPWQLRETGSEPVTLPQELVEHIFHFATAAPTWTTFSQRSATLRAISSLSSSWQIFAQRQLVRHVVLRSELDAKLFLAAREACAEGGRWMPVKTLRIGGGSTRSPPYRLKEVLASCGQDLEELFLVTLRDVDLRLLADVPGLHSLYCIDITLTLPLSPPPQAVHTPSLATLRHLVLKNVSISPSVRTIFFQDHGFPNLVTLFLDSAETLVQIFDDPHSLPSLQVLSPSYDLLEDVFYPAEQLLMLNLEPDFFSSSDWSSSSSSASADSSLEVAMPQSVRFVRFAADVSYSNMLEFFSRHELPFLEKVWLPAWVKEGDDEGQWTLQVDLGSRGVDIEWEAERNRLEEVAFQDEVQPWEFVEKARWVEELLTEE